MATSHGFYWSADVLRRIACFLDHRSRWCGMGAVCMAWHRILFADVVIVHGGDTDIVKRLIETPVVLVFYAQCDPTASIVSGLHVSHRLYTVLMTMERIPKGLFIVNDHQRMLDSDLIPVLDLMTQRLSEGNAYHLQELWWHTEQSSPSTDRFAALMRALLGCPSLRSVSIRLDNRPHRHHSR